MDDDDDDGIWHVPFLPVTVPLNNGSALILRNMRTGEEPAVYSLFRRAALAGEGFGAEEFESMTSFKQWISGKIIIVGTDSKTKHAIILAVALEKSYLLRSQNLPEMMRDVCVLPEFRRQGIMSSCVGFIDAIAYRMGFRSIIIDSSSANAVAAKGLARDGFKIHGSIPNTHFLNQGSGWTDSVITRKVLKPPTAGSPVFKAVL